MPKSKSVARFPSGGIRFASPVLESIHRSASALCKVGAIDRVAMRRFDGLCFDRHGFDGRGRMQGVVLAACCVVSMALMPARPAMATIHPPASQFVMSRSGHRAAMPMVRPVRSLLAKPFQVKPTHFAGRTLPVPLPVPLPVLRPQTTAHPALTNGLARGSACVPAPGSVPGCVMRGGARFCGPAARRACS